MPLFISPDAAISASDAVFIIASTLPLPFPSFPHHHSFRKSLFFRAFTPVSIPVSPPLSPYLRHLNHCNVFNATFLSQFLTPPSMIHCQRHCCFHTVPLFPFPYASTVTLIPTPPILSTLYLHRYHHHHPCAPVSIRCFHAVPCHCLCCPTSPLPPQSLRHFPCLHPLSAAVNPFFIILHHTTVSIFPRLRRFLLP